MGRAQRSEGLSAEDFAEHVEKAFLNRAFNGRDVEGHVNKGLRQLRGELAGEDGVQEGLHILAQGLTDGDGEAADAVKHGVDGSSLAGLHAQSLANVDQDPVEIRRDGALDRIGNIANRKKRIVSLLFLLEHAGKVDHELVQVGGTKLGGGVVGQVGDQENDGLADGRISRIPVAEDDLACILVMVLHVHAALLEELFKDEERGVDVLDRVRLEALNRFGEHLVHPFLLHLLVALPDDFEARTDGFARRCSNEVAGVPEADPNLVEDEAHVWVHEGGRIPGQLAQDEDCTISPLLNAIRLQPLERGVHLGVHQLRYQRAARLAQLAKNHSGGLHRVEVLAAQDGSDVLLKAAVFQGGLDTVKVHKRIKDVDPAHAVVRVGALDQAHRPLVDRVEEALELFGTHLWSWYQQPAPGSGATRQRRLAHLAWRC